MSREHLLEEFPMPITDDAKKASEIITPIGGLGTTEITVGLLGAKADPFRFGFGDAKYLNEVRMLEIERRILEIEKRLTEPPTSAA